MNALPDELRAVVAKERIRDAIARVARGEDRRDAKAIGAAFWPDGSVGL